MTTAGRRVTRDTAQRGRRFNGNAGGASTAAAPVRRPDPQCVWRVGDTTELVILRYEEMRNIDRLEPEIDPDPA